MKAFRLLISAFGLLAIVGAQLSPNVTFTVYETRTTHVWATHWPTGPWPTGPWSTGVLPIGLWPTPCRALNFTALGAGVYTITEPTTLTIADCHCNSTGSGFTIQPFVSTTFSEGPIRESASPFLNFTLPPTLLPPKITRSAIIISSMVANPPALSTETTVNPPALSTETTVDPPASSIETTVTPPIIHLPTVTSSVMTLPTITPFSVTSTISVPRTTSLSSPTTGAAGKVNLRVGAIIVAGIAAMFL